MTQSDAMSPDVAKPYAETTTNNSGTFAPFIEVNSVNAGKMAINVDRIDSITPSESGTQIVFDGNKMLVTETYETLLAALNK
ncbi:MAG: hypothetical protein M3Q07_11605 [Pseudobdellovibrionaceae bacterium]|nr:hypothetical protein [Pseudobdellovibrionaceae bacterium]